MSYKRGIPYIYGSEDDENKIVLHVWGELDESYKDSIWFSNRKYEGIELSGVKMYMKDLD